MSDEPAAARKFTTLVEEARRWKGEPTRADGEGPRRIASWADLEIRQCGRGIMIRARAPWFMWWNEAEVWRDDPMGAVHEWLHEDLARSRAEGPR